MRRAITMVAGLALCCAMATSQAEAAPNVTGPFRAGAAYCVDNNTFVNGWGNRILATSPQIDAAQINGIVGGGQLVGFRAVLEVWNGQRWVTSQRSPLKVHDQGPWSFYSEVWYDFSTGAQVSGLYPFPITTRGYYRVGYDLYWFGDNRVITGYVAAISDGLYDYRRDPPVLVNWCQY
jgi:hypothetical protein